MYELKPEIHIIKERMKDVWSAGDFGVIAKFIEHEGSAFVNRLNIMPDSKVLDVACGTGNSAIPAAKLGARVTGLDFVPHLISQANERAKAENLNVKFDVGDAESMPYADNEFDYVVTMFGAMFCPRPDVVTGELFRVCKPGGIIAMANWTPDGFIGNFFRLSSSYLPPPPGIPTPMSWGTETSVKERFGDKASDIKFNRRILRQNIPMPVQKVVDHFIKYFGPTNKLYELLDNENRMKYKNEMINLFNEHNISETGNVTLNTEYLEVIATKQ